MKSSEVQSPLFTITIPEDNAFGVTNFTNIPQKAISDGYWVEVKGLDPGEHTIEFTGGATAFDICNTRTISYNNRTNKQQR